MTPAEIIARIREARREAGIRQVALADALGISQGHLCDIERGRQQVSLAQACALADALGLEIAIRGGG